MRDWEDKKRETVQNRELWHAIKQIRRTRGETLEYSELTRDTRKGCRPRKEANEVH